MGKLPLMSTILQIQAHVLNVSAKTNWVFIEVKSSNGQSGWGEASLIGWEPMLVAATRELAQQWEGKPLADAQASLRVSPQSPGGLVFNAVISGVHQALASLLAAREPNAQASYKAQAPGPSAADALAGPALRQSVPLYANINRATQVRTPQGFVDTALRARAQGFNRFKAAPFDGLTPTLCGTMQGQALIRHGVDCMFALRDALGPDALLMVDCHWRFDETHALQALRNLAPVALHWFECPIAETHAHWQAIRRLRAASRDQGVLLAAAETQVGLASFQTLFDEALYDVVMPDVKYCGGPLEMLKIAQRAADHGVQFSPHNPSGPICTWHSLQVAALAPECTMLELQFDESALYDEVIDGPPLPMKDAYLTLSRPYERVLALKAQVLQTHPYQPVPPGIETQLNR
jgi:galactonate dehydratase